MRARVGMSAMALGLSLLGGAVVEFPAATAAPAAPTHTKSGKQCPAKQVKKVWRGGTSKQCPNLPDELDHLFYQGPQYTTALRRKYRERTLFIQLRLHDLGYGPIVRDGYYGTQTKDVVKRYQRRQGLVVDGKVGLQTWKSLFGLGRA